MEFNRTIEYFMPTFHLKKREQMSTKVNGYFPNLAFSGSSKREDKAEYGNKTNMYNIVEEHIRTTLHLCL